MQTSILAIIGFVENDEDLSGLSSQAILDRCKQIDIGVQGLSNDLFSAIYKLSRNFNLNPEVLKNLLYQDDSDNSLINGIKEIITEL